MKASVVSVVLVCATLGFACNGAVAAELRIGVVNMQRLLQQSPQAQSASKKMEKKFDSRRKGLLDEQNKIKDLQDKINKNGAIMSANQLQDMQGQLSDLQRDFNRKQGDYLDDLNSQRNEELGKLQHDIVQAVQEFAKDKQYNLIIGEGVFYADNAVDVTDQVLSQLQKDFKAQDSKSGG
ncbi:MAG TPA: OmpH family outer membrane protein [Gammaproteobacteria bacterium]|nr:OmpH family outer membrane protein [Gammaproteobacteria bacterium]